MTLCLAWKQNNQINLATDSRSGHDGSYNDTTPKLFALRVKIITPDGQNSSRTDYEQTIGICYSGMVSDSIKIIEFVSEAMQNLDYVPEYMDLSLENICQFFGYYFQTVAISTKLAYDIDPDMNFLISGYCPKLKEVAIYHLTLYPTGDEEYDLSLDRVLEDPEEIVSIGSGSDRARAALDDIQPIKSTEVLKVLRSVCIDDDDDVGGFIQYGMFEEKDFKIFGIQDYHIDDLGELEILYTYRGILTLKGNFEVDEKRFQMRMRYLCPFEAEIDEHLFKP